MEHARHVLRALSFLLLAVVVFVLGRTALVPRSYGLYGAYRHDNVAEQASARAPLHRGAGACAECHDDRATAVGAGAHARVSCEICHGPAGGHVRDGEVIAAMNVDRSFTLCSRCHRRILGRPDGFPQVVLEQHLHDQGASSRLEGRVCLECHDPHSPKL